VSVVFRSTRPKKASLTAADLNEGNNDLAPFPDDKTVYQTVMLEGRTLKYAATIGSLPVLDEKGHIAGSVVGFGQTRDNAVDSAILDIGENKSRVWIAGDPDAVQW
jgi:hypothetical protein